MKRKRLSEAGGCIGILARLPKILFDLPSARLLFPAEAVRVLDTAIVVTNAAVTSILEAVIPIRATPIWFRHRNTIRRTSLPDSRFSRPRSEAR